MQNSIKEHRSPFLERWSKAEAINGKLMVSILILTLLCAVLGMALIQSVLKPRPIYYIPSIREAGIAHPESMPEEVVSLFAVSWILNWLNFTPLTVEDSYNRSTKFMFPHFLAKAQAIFDKDIVLAKANKMSSLFSISQDPQLIKNDRSYTVVIAGENIVFNGKDVVSTLNIVFRIVIKKVNPTEMNPYGLMIESYDRRVSKDEM